ncbi:hypothetical protein F751_2322 [Auxenochlorella protothecoides]|uniref:SAP domain-containing protein n=1 Tax=Auxenochlorella protothecoides TaxID=3075 RepID=A0A087SFV0_AUXPR|nr:hypothetical protein F751_2322 [Auxenochlorella protothecoides]KFM24604.1 hypothetical protein F751_2322 [Auxenochlorella protothecoides]
MSTDWVHELTVAKLKDELKKRDLHVTGKKAELIERLEEFLKEAEGADAASDGKSADEGAEPQDEDMKDAAADEASQDDNADRKDGGSESRFTSSDDEAVPVESSGHGSPAKGDGSMHSEDRSGAAVAGQDGGAGAEEAVAADEESGPVANGDGAEAPAAPGAGSETPAVAGASERESKEDPVPEAASPAGKPEAPTAASLVEEVVDLDYGEEEAEAAAAAAAATSVRTKGAAAAGASPGTVPTSGKRPRGDDDAPAAAAAPLQKAPRAERPAAEGVVTASTTRALRIDGFVRPFTERAVRELLDPTGAELKALWMPSIKTHCYSAQDEPGEPLQLDDLFRRTAAKPSLYWLPLTAEQGAAKRAGAGNGQAAAIPGSEAALETRRPLPA